MKSVCLPLSSLINTMSFKNLMIAVMKIIIILMDWNQQINEGTWILAGPEKTQVLGLALGERVAKARLGAGCIILGACFFLICAAVSSPSLWLDFTLRSLGRMGRSNKMFPGGGYHADVGLVKIWFFSFLVTEMARGVSDFLPKAPWHVCWGQLSVVKSRNWNSYIGCSSRMSFSTGRVLHASCFRRLRAGQGRRKWLLD